MGLGATAKCNLLQLGRKGEKEGVAVEKKGVSQFACVMLIHNNSRELSHSLNCYIDFPKVAFPIHCIYHLAPWVNRRGEKDHEMQGYSLRHPCEI